MRKSELFCVVAIIAAAVLMAFLYARTGSQVGNRFPDLSQIDACNRDAAQVARFPWKIEKIAKEADLIWVRITADFPFYVEGRRIEGFSLRVGKDHKFFTAFAALEEGKEIRFYHLPRMEDHGFPEIADFLAPRCEEVERYIREHDLNSSY